MTETFRISLAWMTLLLAPADPAPTDQVDLLLRQLAPMQPAEQQRFLAWIETRLLRAQGIVLDAEEAAAAGTALGQRLRRQAVTWPELRAVLIELDRRENRAIEQLVRWYRLQTFRTFRNDRHTYEQRQQAWFDLWSAWEAAGRPLTHQHELLDWLVAAIRCSRPETVAALPAPPRLEGRSLASVLPRVPSRAPLEPPKPPAAGLQAAAEPRVATEPPVAADPFGEPAPPMVSTLPSPPPGPIRPAPPRAADRAAGGLEPASLAIARRATTAAARRGEPAPGVSDLQVVAEPGDLPATAPNRPAGTRAVLGPRAAGSVTSRREVASPNALPFLGAAAVPAAPSSASAEVRSEPVARVAAAGRPAERRQRLPQRPAPPPEAIPKADTAPQVARPDRRVQAEAVAVPTSVARGVQRAVRRPPLDEPGRSVASSGEPAEARPRQPAVQVNVAELRSRIAGTNMALRALESELYEPRRWSADQLAPQIARLHALIVRVEDMRLFREMVPEPTRHLIDGAESPRPAITLLADRIAEVRQRVVAGAFSGTEAARRAELAKLDELSRRLVEMAALVSR